MSEEQNRSLNDKFMLRLPDGMRDQIKASALKNNRSMNAEIVHAIGFYFAFDDMDPSRNAALSRELDDTDGQPLNPARKQDLIRRSLAELERQLIAALEDPTEAPSPTKETPFTTRRNDPKK